MGPIDDGGPPPPVASVTGSLRRKEIPYRPPWLPGLGTREINRASDSERALASKIVPCWEPAAAGAPFWRTRLGYGRWAENQDPLAAEWLDLSHHFDRSIFKVDPPPDRAEAIDVVHSVIALLPEAAALAVQSCLQPGRNSMAAMVATSAVGLVSLSGVGMLAVLEVRGSRFRAAADLDWLEVHLLPDVERAASVNRCLTGVPLACSELMLLASAVGYRPGLLVALAVGSTALYLLVSAAASSTASPIRRRTRLTQVQREQLDPVCRSWPVTWREEVVLLVRGDSFPPPAELVANWALRRGSGHRCLWLLRSTTLLYARGGSSPRADTPSKAPRPTVPWMLEQ
ncbi:hypothetical protein I4F81_005341 [Pyropia yezoensis]|uniref:Uncharacterized protein n=1 Tax=Pyropia yezoensis TaxID=2788 RepID=A0ACC3BXP7_PYRYE|nr:hypothetical protein I4F81_005341 [Neopyropia yezoensis]